MVTPSKRTPETPEERIRSMGDATAEWLLYRGWIRLESCPSLFKHPMHAMPPMPLKDAVIQQHHLEQQFEVEVKKQVEAGAVSWHR